MKSREKRFDIFLILTYLIHFRMFSQNPPPSYSNVTNRFDDPMNGSNPNNVQQPAPPAYPIDKIIDEKLQVRQEKRLEYLKDLEEKAEAAVNFAKQERTRIEKLHENEKRKLMVKKTIVKKKRDLTKLHNAELERRRQKMIEIRQQREEMNLHNSVEQLQLNQDPHIDHSY